MSCKDERELGKLQGLFVYLKLECYRARYFFTFANIFFAPPKGGVNQITQ